MSAVVAFQFEFGQHVAIGMLSKLPQRFESFVMGFSRMGLQGFQMLLSKPMAFRVKLHCDVALQCFFRSGRQELYLNCMFHVQCKVAAPISACGLIFLELFAIAPTLQAHLKALRPDPTRCQLDYFIVMVYLVGFFVSQLELNYLQGLLFHSHMFNFASTVSFIIISSCPTPFPNGFSTCFVMFAYRRFFAMFFHCFYAV